jgi:hypothetical protein
MPFLSHVRKFLLLEDESPSDVIARLLLAAKEDKAFRDRIRFLLRAPSAQRQSLVNSALHEMTLRGEPQNVRTAFALLATDEGAETALRVLNAK